MTLNTFHQAGVSQNKVTQGVPRLTEVINVSRFVRTPSLAVRLRPEFSDNEDHAKAVLDKLEYTTLHSITERTQIYYDPDPENTVVEEDRDFVRSYFEVPDEVRCCAVAGA